MHPKLYAALKAQTEARMAYNALGDDSEEAELRVAAEAVTAADQAVVDAFEEGATAPAELRDRISLGRYLTAFASEQVPDGAEAELRKELGLSDQALPLEAMLPTVEERAELRADAVSPQNQAGNALLGFGTVYQTTGPLLNRVFTATDTGFLGVAMPTVPPGERVYPVMVDGTEAGMAARGADAPDAGAAKFAVVNATPHRLSGRYVFDLEGVATLGGLLESTLRADLRLAMGYALDRQILLGSGAGANVTGLINAITAGLPPAAAYAKPDLTNVVNWSDLRHIGTRGLDGKYARSEADLRVLIGKDTYMIGRDAFRNANAADANDGIGAMRALGMAVRESFQIPDPAVAHLPGNDANQNSTKKVQRVIVNSEPRAAVAPVWQGVTMIRDPYSQASKAEVVITAHMLFDFVMRRTDGWKQYYVRTES